jgi:hypothetical protein
MGKRYSGAQASALLSEYRGSGLSRREYVKRSGISLSYLDALIRRSKDSASGVGEGQGFVEVQQPPVLNRRHLVEIQLFDGTTIKIGG